MSDDAAKLQQIREAHARYRADVERILSEP